MCFPHPRSGLHTCRCAWQIVAERYGGASEFAPYFRQVLTPAQRITRCSRPQARPSYGLQSSVLLLHLVQGTAACGG